VYLLKYKNSELVTVLFMVEEELLYNLAASQMELVSLTRGVGTLLAFRRRATR
jgi:hypothetical protein